MTVPSYEGWQKAPQRWVSQPYSTVILRARIKGPHLRFSF